MLRFFGLGIVGVGVGVGIGVGVGVRIDAAGGECPLQHGGRGEIGMAVCWGGAAVVAIVALCVLRR